MKKLLAMVLVTLAILASAGCTQPTSDTTGDTTTEETTEGAGAETETGEGG